MLKRAKESVKTKESEGQAEAITDQVETEMVVTEENRTAVEEGNAKATEKEMKLEKTTKQIALEKPYEAWKNSHSSFTEAVLDAENMPLGEPPQPEMLAERAKLLQFQQILIIASTNEADKAIVTASLSIHVLVQPPVFQTGVL